MQSDDVVRAEAQRRLGATEPLDVHSGMKKVHAEFKSRGGMIRVLGARRDLPVLTWDKEKRHVRSAKWPAHLSHTELRGTKRAIERAELLATVHESPFLEADAS